MQKVGEAGTRTPSKVTIVGVGQVGMACAYSIMQQVISTNRSHPRLWLLVQNIKLVPRVCILPLQGKERADTGSKWKLSIHFFSPYIRSSALLSSSFCFFLPSFLPSFLLSFLPSQARRRGCSRSSNEPPLEVNNGGLKAQTVDFQLLANSGGMKSKLKLPCKKMLIVL